MDNKIFLLPASGFSGMENSRDYGSIQTCSVLFLPCCDLILKHNHVSWPHLFTDILLMFKSIRSKSNTYSLQKNYSMEKYKEIKVTNINKVDISVKIG